MLQPILSLMKSIACQSIGDIMNFIFINRFQPHMNVESAFLENAYCVNFYGVGPYEM